jgi:hypothetical protein
MTSMIEGSVHQLELIPLGLTSWRLFDRSVDVDDPASLVAYVEETLDGYEVVWLQARAGWSRFTSLDEVLRAAAADLSPTAADRARRPIEIPHFAPKSPPR